MTMIVNRTIPLPKVIKEKYPLTNKIAKIREERNNEIYQALTGQSNKFLMIIGPCSADNKDAVLDYVCRLAKIQEKVKDKIIVIPRVYTNKPRTIGIGYKGMIHQPDPIKEENMLGGLIAVRELHLKVIEESGLTSADEMLYTELYTYFSDLLSYTVVGARCVENQQHRQTASGIDIPVGIKNPISGDLSVMLNAIYAVQNKHTFIYRDCEVHTTGNPLAHAILRGACNKHGQNIPNYNYEELSKFYELYSERELTNMALIVDTNHSNSKKQYLEQISICKEVLQSRRRSENLKRLVKGLMVESYIKDGNQSVTGNVYGQSITDPCLGWEKTESLIFDVAELL